MTRIFRTLFLFISFFLILTGCDLLSSIEDFGAPTTTPEPTATQITSRPPLTGTTPQAATPVPPISQLRVWIPSEVGARTDPGSQEFNNQLRAFEASHANVTILVEQKPVEGTGGILNYLRSGQEVAPSVMPDLIALPASLLSESVVQDLVVPLDNLLAVDEIGGLYPAPAADVRRNESLFGFPFATAGLTHLVYDPAVITDTIPLTWPQFISETNHTMVLPADSREGAMLGLQFYLAEGGTLQNEAGQTDLQVEPLTRALEEISLNKANLLQSHQMKTLDEAWQYFQLGLSEFVWARADYFLGQQDGETISPGQNLGYLPVPGPNGPLVPLTNSWAWSISTPDTARQALAAELVEWLTEPINVATWSNRARILPASREATAILAEQDNYYLFVGREMERAEGMPISQSSRALDVIGEAVFSVLTTDTPPAVLAEAAVTALRQ
jgi:ABC-type glycerol-3-phosphate transport system substrate-binding protein